MLKDEDGGRGREGGRGGEHLSMYLKAQHVCIK
jgi:hypothetical protein